MSNEADTEENIRYKTRFLFYILLSFIIYAVLGYQVDSSIAEGNQFTLAEKSIRALIFYSANFIFFSIIPIVISIFVARRKTSYRQKLSVLSKGLLFGWGIALFMLYISWNANNIMENSRPLTIQ